LLSPLVSEAVAVKEDRRVRHPTAPSSSNNSSNQATNDKSSSSNSKQSDTAMVVDQDSEVNAGEESNTLGGTSSALKPSEIQLM
jgi:hypothetical protein